MKTTMGRESFASLKFARKVGQVNSLGQVTTN